MNKATHKNKRGSGPLVFRFKAQLLRHPKVAKNGSCMLLNVPLVISKKLPSRGSTTVEGTINGHPFRASLGPNTSGSHRLRVNRAMSEGASAKMGDTVQLAVLVPEPEPTVPADFWAALTASQEAKTFWKAITYMNRHDWIRWIDSAKKSETRVHRIALAVEWLSSGKRQPCCFNTYEYMLARIHKNRNRKNRIKTK